MTLHGEFQTVLIAILFNLALLIPVVATLIRVYIQAKINTYRLQDTPTHAEVQDKINTTVQNLLAQNGTGRDRIGEGHGAATEH